MHAQASETPPTEEERDPLSTYDDLRDIPIRPGDVVVPFTDDRWYIVLRRSPTPASAFGVSDGGTLDETAGCKPDDDVLVGVNLREVQATPGVEAFEDVRAAVLDGRLDEVALPESSYVPAFDAFVEAAQRGEWDGLVDYLREAHR